MYALISLANYRNYTSQYVMSQRVKAQDRSLCLSHSPLNFIKSPLFATPMAQELFSCSTDRERNFQLLTLPRRSRDGVALKTQEGEGTEPKSRPEEGRGSLDTKTNGYYNLVAKCGYYQANSKLFIKCDLWNEVAHSLIINKQGQELLVTRFTIGKSSV